MGVSSEHIILYGWDVGYEKVADWDYEEREPYYYDEREEGEPVLVFDGRSGEYALVGIMQFCSGDRRWEQADIPMQTINSPTEQAQRELFRTVYQEMDIDPDGDPEHFVFTHHS